MYGPTGRTAVSALRELTLETNLRLALNCLRRALA